MQQASHHYSLLIHPSICNLSCFFLDFKNIFLFCLVENFHIFALSGGYLTINLCTETMYKSIHNMYAGKFIGFLGAKQVFTNERWKKKVTIYNNIANTVMVNIVVVRIYLFIFGIKLHWKQGSRTPDFLDDRIRLKRTHTWKWIPVLSIQFHQLIQKIL